MSEMTGALTSELSQIMGDGGPLKDAWKAAPWHAKLRLILALILTYTLLPYAWGRTFLVYMMTGRVEPPFALQVTLGVVLIAALTFRLGAKFPGERFAQIMAVAVVVLWGIACAGLVIFRAGELISPYPVAALFVLATVWLIWAAWMFFLQFSWSTRALVLAVALVLVAPFVMVFRVDGLTGDANVDFNYRSAPQRGDLIAAELHSKSVGGGQRISLEPKDGLVFMQFQGPMRNAVLPGVRLERDWKNYPPKELWRTSVGEGWSGFAVSGDAAITQEQRGANECVVCRNILTGDEAWVHADAARYDSSLGGNGPRATPTIHHDRVYTIGATGILNCIEGSTGKLVWSANIQTDHNAESIYHGVCASPLVISQSDGDDLVLVCPTGKDGRSLAAYRNGKVVWSKGTYQASYSSPMIAEVAGIPQILVYNSRALTSHDPHTGDVLWNFEWHNTEHIAAAQPVLIPGKPDEILISTGYGKGSTLIRVMRTSYGSFETPQQLWSSRTMKTKFTTAVAHGEHVYGLDDGILQCIAVADGKSKWKAGRYGHGQLLLVDNVLLIQTEPGDVVLVEANPQKLVELARLPAVSGKTWNNPTLAGRYLLSRNDHEGACFELPLAK